MIGLIEACQYSGATVLDVAQNAHLFLRQPHSSKKTELVLQTASRITFSENCKENLSEKFRLISNLIFSANEYWDIGLRAKEELFKNKAYKFVALNTIFSETKASLNKSLAEFNKNYPHLSELATIFIEDGEVLAKHRQDFSGIQYREIDSGISALFTFKSVCPGNYFESLGIDSSQKCQSSADLFEKYKYFLVNEINIDQIDNKLKPIVGLQAIEMMVACQDDRWGTIEDSILRIPNTMDKGLKENKKLFDSYKNKAVECGFSPLIPEVLSRLSSFHRLKSKRIKNLDTIEINDIQKCQNLHQIHYLREWLNESSLLPQLFS
ncbi:MAG TPA: hypothetical protein PKI92_02100 [Candidatus Woesebacteria bacterium]|nr:hypothetical protein [Candidatus Woesebacteria bacterium]HPR99816.1 hypothetical protein [Candidatus Woesebacteria bacterium]